MESNYNSLSLKTHVFSPNRSSNANNHIIPLGDGGYTGLGSALDTLLRRNFANCPITQEWGKIKHSQQDLQHLSVLLLNKVIHGIIQRPIQRTFGGDYQHVTFYWDENDMPIFGFKRSRIHLPQKYESQEQKRGSEPRVLLFGLSAFAHTAGHSSVGSGEPTGTFMDIICEMHQTVWRIPVGSEPRMYLVGVNTTQALKRQNRASKDTGFLQELIAKLNPFKGGN